MMMRPSMRIKLGFLSSLLLLSACQPETQQANAAAERIDYQAIPNYTHDVIGMQESYLEPAFWLQKLPDPNAVILTPTEVAAFNARSYDVQDELVRLNSLPTDYSAAELLAKIDSISTLPKYPRYYADGTQASDGQLQSYRDAVNTAAVAESNPVQFGLVVNRTPMRTFPTLDKLYSEGLDLDIDRFQETGLFPGTAVAILHTSADGDWYLAQSYNYLAWVQAKDVAIGDRDVVLAYTEQTPYAIVSGSTVRTVYNPEVSAVSEVQLDMGSRLPLLSAAETGHNVHGQNPFATYIVKLPVRNLDGKLDFEPALIPRSADMHIGQLPYTEAVLISQAFKFLGERYGWGHDFNGRDCTGFVSEVYRSVGIDMPRNSGQQGYGEYGQTTLFSKDASREEKLARIKQARIGDLMYLPGHVVMYIGEINGEPYVIHDVHGMSYHDNDGNYYKGTLNGVSVTPLLTLGFGKDATYLDAIYSIKTVR